MIKIFNVIGARPQIIKSSAISRIISEKYKESIDEIIVHTGQHYDKEMSDIFFKEMNIPKPSYNLNVRSDEHGKQTASIINGLEDLFKKESPDFIIVYGDTNTTLAAAITAAKMNIKIVHIEAGMRSFNKKMPEEINRIMCDHVSSLLFTPTKTGLNNLIREGFNSLAEPPFHIDNPGIFHCGDIMYDNAIYFSKYNQNSFSNYEKYILITIHRPINSDKPERLLSILKAIIDNAKVHKLNVIWPVHPRTNKIIQVKLNSKYKFLSENIHLIKPVGYLDILKLEQNASIIITDSGGIQKEAYYFKKPCIILRNETEWKEIIDEGTGLLVDADPQKIHDAFDFFLKKHKMLKFKSLFGDGNAANFIIEKIIENHQV